MVGLLNEVSKEEKDVINYDSLSFIAQRSRIITLVDESNNKNCSIKLRTNNEAVSQVYHELKDKEKICDDELFRQRLLNFYNVYNPDFLKNGIDVNKVVSDNKGKAAEVFKRLEKKYILKPLNQWKSHNYDIVHTPLYAWEQKKHSCNDDHKQN
eukprot:UN10238